MSSYKRIAAVETALKILEFLAHRKEPASGQEVAEAMDIPHGTAMCHLVTLEDARFARRVGDGYELAMNAALLWARKKALLQGEIDRASRDLARLEQGGE